MSWWGCWGEAPLANLQFARTQNARHFAPKPKGLVGASPPTPSQYCVIMVYNWFVIYLYQTKIQVCYLLFSDFNIKN